MIIPPLPTCPTETKSAQANDPPPPRFRLLQLLDLKKAIVDKKKMHQGMEFDLNIVNDKTKEGETKDGGS